MSTGRAFIRWAGIDSARYGPVNMKHEKFIEKAMRSKLFELQKERFSLIIFNCVAALPHLPLLIFFYVHQIGLMIYVNAASLLVYVVSLLLVFKKRNTASCALVAAEIIAYSSISSIFLGLSAAAHLYLFNLIFALYLFKLGSSRERRVLISLAIAAFVAQTLCVYLEPPVYIAQDFSILGMLSTLFVMLVLVFMLLFNFFSEQLTYSYMSSRINILANEVLIDPLTTLLNRRYVEQYASRERPGGITSVAVLDIDDFKKVNDTLGHDAGDEVLKQFASMLKEKFRATDSVVRWGGEEFVLILGGVSGENAKLLLESFLRRVEKTPFPCAESIIHITATAGIAQIEPEMSVQEAISAADKNMYLGKRQGKNRAIYL